MRDKRVLMVWLFVFLLLATICTFFSRIQASHASQVIQVPQDYPTIQEAIDNAVDYDTIQVNRRSGESQSIYYETLTVDKELTLLGESRETVIIDGGGAGSVIRVMAHNVEISGFTIRNGGTEYNGIRSNGYYYVTVANNTLCGNRYGISLLNSDYHTVVENLLFNNSVTGISLSESIGNNVSDNEVSDSSYGIRLSSADATFVIGNTVSDSSYGISLQDSSNDTVKGNNLTGNGVSGILSYLCHDIIVSNNGVMESAYGIELYTSDTITILGNDATDNSYGIYLAHSNPSNIIENNTISANDWGVKLYNSSSNTIRGNTLSCNTYGVDPEAESNNNVVYHNNFIDNIEQAVWNPDCVNTWDNGYPSGGNYWSDYTGTDSNGDGIGDTSYNIDPMNRDRYPLMTEWGGIHDVAIVNVTPSTTIVPSGDIIYINVTAKNEGIWRESFEVTTKYDDTEIGTQTIANLAPEASRTLTFEWNTTDVPLGDHTIVAIASTVYSEIDTADNTYIYGAVTVGVHDVAIIALRASPRAASPGEPIYINVTVQNQGDYAETFNVTVYADMNATIVGDEITVGNQTAYDLLPGANQTLEFMWNTTDIRRGNYWISAEADEVPSEIDTADNIFKRGAFIGGIYGPYRAPEANILALLAPLVLAISIVVLLGMAVVLFIKALMSPKLGLPWNRHIDVFRIHRESFPK